MPAKILVVEDEAITARDIQTSLEKMGYTVTGISATGADAVKKAGLTRPDLVLMDIVLKGKKTGTEAAETIKKKFDIPVVYLTAYADDQTLTAAKKAEPFGYITKPFNDTDIKVTIEMALYKAKMEAERRELTAALKQALSEVKTLRGLIPICAACKKIRDDDGYWASVEMFIENRTLAEFTHGICPDCVHKLYPELFGTEPADHEEEDDDIV